MSARERLVVTVGLSAFIGVHAYENLISSEHWPFCSYPMYSWVEVREAGVTSFRVSGVLASGEELRLQSEEYLFPFDQSRLADAFRDMQGKEGSAIRSREALANFYALYERRRREGDHDGPALNGMRLYRTKHSLDSLARNLLTPDERELLAEVRASTGP